MKKFSLYLSLLGLVLFAGFQNISAQLTGTKNIPGDYATLDLAIIDLNAQGVGVGGVTLNVVAGNTQFAPAGGYTITTTTATLANPVVIQGNFNAVLASNAQPVGSVNDAIFKIVGADFIAITGFIMQENPANVVTAIATNTMTEWGVALLYASTTNGAQFNAVAGNAISLNRAYSNSFGVYSNTRHTAAAPTVAADITAASGSNSGNRIVANQISNVNMGVAFIGSSVVGFQDVGNYVGGGQTIMGNTITNWGGAAAGSAYVSNSGTSYCIFMNHQNTYNVSNNTITSAAVTPAVTFRGIVQDFTVTSPAGVITDTISNNTITMTSAATSGTFRAIDAVGGNNTTTLHITGNNIINCAISGVASSSVLLGISNSGSINTLNINNNIIRSNTSTATSGGFTGIVNSGTVTTAININNNQLGNASGGAITFSAATSGTLLGLSCTGGASTCSTSISNNDIRGIVYSAASTATNTYITGTGAALAQTIANNTFTNLNVNTSGTTTFINHNYTMPASGSMIISGNSIVTAFNRGGASGSVVISTTNGSSPNGTTATYSNNNFSNITVAGSTSIMGFNNTDGTGGTSTKTITNNTFNGWTAGTSTITGMNISYWNGVSSLSSNTLTNFTTQSSIVGFSINNSLGTATSVTIGNNIINGFSSTAAGAAVTGITISNTSPSISINNNTINTLSSAGASLVNGISVTGATSTSVSKNKIYDLSSSNATGTVSGILISGGTLVTASNNIIGDLRTTTANAANPLNGINISGGTTVNAYYNTIYLNATSSGAAFGSTGINASTTPTVDLRNNLVVNLSTPNTTGITAAYRRSSTTLTSYANTSNNNSFYAGTPGTNNLIFYDGTNSMQTLAAYKTFVSPRDGASLSENPTFSSTSGASPVFLHIPAATSSLLESGGTVIGTITTDYDNDTRPGPAGSVNGGGSAPDIGADEFDGAPVLCSAANGGAIAPTTYTRCENQTVVLTSTGVTSGPGITYQWQVSNTPGGPYASVVGGSGATTPSYTSGALVAGTYYYVLQTTCSVGPLTGLSNEVTVTVNPAPTISVTPTSGTICLPGGAAIPLAASGTSTSYAWLPVAGLTPSTGANVSASPTATTTYTVTGTDGAGCTNTATAIISVFNTPVIASVTATPSSVCSGGNSQLLTSAYTPAPVNGYLFSTGTGAALDPMIGATQVIGTGDDDTPTAAAAPIGFSFIYNGTNYTQYSVSPDGWILLGGAAAANEFTNAVTSTTNIPKIYPFWDDLATGTTGNVKTLLTGTAPNRIFIVQWFVTVPRATGGPANSTFQTWLYEADGKIEFRYGTMGVPSSGSISGGLTASATNFNCLTFASNSNNTSVANDVNSTSPATGRIYTFTPPVPSYAWSPATFLSSTTINNPMANAVTATTTYTVTVSNGSCSATGSATITSGAALTSTAITTNSPVCQGADIIATANPSGGGAPYSYSWDINGGAPFTSPTATATITGLAPGTYTLNSAVTDACLATTSQSISITVNPRPTVSVSTTPITTAVCAGSTYTITGNGASTYTWSPATYLSAITGTNINVSGTVNNFTPITYTMIGTDLNGCIDTATQAVTLAPPHTMIATTSASSVCIGTTVNLALTDSVILTGPSSLPVGYCAAGAATCDEAVNAFTFNTISNTSGCAGGYANNTATSTIIAPGSTYPISITTTLYYAGDQCSVWFDWNRDGDFGDAGETFVIPYSGAGGVFSSSILVPSTASYGATMMRVRMTYTGLVDPCGTATYGEVEDYTVNLQYRSVAPGANTYAWSPVTTPATGTAVSHTPPVGTTVYTATATDAIGCSVTATANVTVNPLPTPTANNTGPYCAGTTIQLNSPTGSATDDWTGPSYTQNNTQNPTIASSTVGMSGVYTVTVTDLNGCSATATTNVVVNPAPTPTANNTGPYCAGATIQLNSPTGSATDDWTGPLSYSQTNTQNPTIASSTVAMSGDYTVTVTNGSGCSATATTTVVVNALPTPTANNTGPYCVGSTIQLNSPTGSATDDWTGPSYTQNNTQNPTIASSTVANSGVYTVTVTDLNGCSATASTTVVVNALPTPTANNTGPYCSGTTIQLNSPTGSATDDWTGPLSYAVSNVQNPTIPTSTVAMSGDYTVTVTDLNGCSATATTTVLVNGPATPTANNTGPYCAGATIQLNSPTGTATDDWSGPSSYSATNVQNPTIPSSTVAMSGDYTVTVTDINGCFATATTTVVVNALPTPTATNTGPYCVGSTIQLNSPSGSATDDWTGPLAYTQTDLQNPTIASSTVAMSGDYTVTVTDVNGCSATASTTVVVNSLPTPTANNTGPYCVGATIQLNSPSGSATDDWTGPLSYSTNDVQNPTIAFSTVPMSGVYTVTVTNASGCSATATTTVLVNVGPSVNLGADIIQPNPPAVLDAGAGFATYLWSTTETTQTISVNTNGQYIVTVTTAGVGCSDSDTINVNFTSGVVNINGTPTLFSLYPNPTSNGVFNVSVENIETTNLVMEVLDMNGSVVHNKYVGSVNGNVIEPFSLTDLRMGTYIMRITANGKSTQLRFIINR